MSLFVAGTDAGVGKTVVSALLLARYGGELDLAYWKPISTGAGGSLAGRDSATLAALTSLVTSEIEVRLEMHLLPDAVSPHLAARGAGVTIDIDAIAEAWEDWKRVSPERGVVVEGVGGVMVPLNERQRLSKGGNGFGAGDFGGSPLGSGRSAGGELLIDLMALLELPVVLVARSTPGTINPTLLTLDALRRRGIPVAGVVLDGPVDDENRQAIEAYGDVRVVATVEPFELSAERVKSAAAAFDREGELRRYLQRA